MPRRLMCLNTGSPAGGAVLEGCTTIGSCSLARPADHGAGGVVVLVCVCVGKA